MAQSIPSDLATHAFLYRSFHPYAVWCILTRSLPRPGRKRRRRFRASAPRDADYFNGAVPVTEPLTDEEIEGDYELNTGGIVILWRFKNLDPEAVPGVLVAGHAPFTWGKTPEAAAHTAVARWSTSAKLAFRSCLLQPGLGPLSPALLRRHYERKHGANATAPGSAEPKM